MSIFKNKGVIKILFCFTIAVVLLAGSLPIVQGVNINQAVRPWYQFRRYTDNSKSLSQMYYRLAIPDDYDESIAYPLVVFLSVEGQTIAMDAAHSTNPLKFIDTSLLVNGNDKKYPCIILIPILPDGFYWVDNYYDKISDALDLTMGMIDVTCKEYSVDQRKVYITGVCANATGAWDAMFRFPQKFAAGVTVANIAPLSLASKIPDVPVWIFNSALDPLVSVSQSRGMVDALKKAGNMNVRYTEYKNYDHIKASYAPYWEEDLFPWMFSQTNLNAPFPEGKIPVGEVQEKPPVNDNPPIEDDIPPDGDNIIPDEKPEDPKDEPIVDHEPEDDNKDIIPDEKPEDPKDEQIINDRVQEPAYPIKKSNFQIASILTGVLMSLDVLLLVFYKIILFIRAKSSLKDGAEKE